MSQPPALAVTFSAVVFCGHHGATVLTDSLSVQPPILLPRPQAPANPPAHEAARFGLGVKSLAR
jgi:hypothetical protein